MKSIPPSVMMFNLAWVAVILFAIITHFTEGFQFKYCGNQSYLFFLLGILAFFAQLFFTKAIQIEAAAIISIFQTTSQVFFSFILQIVIFYIYPDMWSISGAVLVVLAVSLVTSFRCRSTLSL